MFKPYPKKPCGNHWMGLRNWELQWKALEVPFLVYTSYTGFWPHQFAKQFSQNVREPQNRGRDFSVLFARSCCRFFKRVDQMAKCAEDWMARAPEPASAPQAGSACFLPLSWTNTQVNLNWLCGLVVWWLRGGFHLLSTKLGSKSPNHQSRPPIWRRLKHM